MRKNVAAVFFDMGSTLSHQDPSREDLVMRFLNEEGHFPSERQLRHAFLQADRMWTTWAAELPLHRRSDEDRQTMRRRYRDLLMEDLALPGDNGLPDKLQAAWRISVERRHNAIYADVLPTLEEMHRRGLRLGIISNWNMTLEDHCQALGLTSHLETIVCSMAVGFEKPDPAIFKLALERLGVAAEEAMHVGDMYEADVLGARQAGLLPVLLDRYDLQPDVDCLRVQSLSDLLTLIPARTGGDTA